MLEEAPASLALPEKPVVMGKMVEMGMTGNPVIVEHPATQDEMVKREETETLVRMDEMDLMEKMVHLVGVEIQAETVRMVILVRTVHLDLTAIQELQGNQDKMGYLETVDLMVDRELQAGMEHLDLEVLPVHRDRTDSQVTVELMGLLDNLVMMAEMGLTEGMDLMVVQDNQEKEENQETVVNQVDREREVPMVPLVGLAMTDGTVPPDKGAAMEILDLQVREDNPEPQEHKETEVDRELLVEMVKTGSMDRMAPTEKLASQDFLELMV